ncbi:hypothetical protein GCM10022406_18340 [Hymenobacter algoricola]|uniref:T9SS type A sorting domain-containing protein n=1 Tax=Hymenobacter algoricola TaxID=486267 RepID=A0ABP7N0Y9_9BACT
MIDSFGGTSFGIAVSKLRNGSVRDLYHGPDAFGGLSQYVISGAGISAGTTYSLNGVPASTTEMDISPDGQSIAWQHLDKVYRLNRAVNNGALDISLLSTYTPELAPGVPVQVVRGLEFSPDSKKILVAGYRNQPIGTSPTAGIISLDRVTGQSSYVAGSASCGNTQLELAYDGLIYGIANSGSLCSINPASLAFATSPLSPALTLHPTSAAAPYDSPFERLPNQIDGEDYQFFFGVAAATLSTPQVDGLSILPGLAQNVYNCKPLALSATVTNASSVRVTVTSALADGTLTSAFTATTGFTPALPTSLLPLLNGRTGYFQVSVEARNSCGQTVQRRGLVQVSSLTPSSAVLKFNDCGGVAQTPSNDPAVPTVVGQYGASIGISNSTGDYDTYQATFEQWDGGTTYYQIGNKTGAIARTGNLAAIPLNGLANQAGLGSGYFTPGNAGSELTVRLTITLNNACGSSTATGIFKPADTNCRGTLADGATRQPDARVAFFPNPLANERGRFEYTIPVAQPVTLTLVDALTGQVRLTLLSGATQAAGAHTLDFDASHLPKGLYFYRLVTDRVVVGRLAKSE